MEEVLGTKEYNEKAEELVKRIDVEDSPFQVIEVEGKCFGVMGKYRITEPLENVDQVRKELNDITWNRIIQVMLVCIDQKEVLINLIKEEEV